MRNKETGEPMLDGSCHTSRSSPANAEGCKDDPEHQSQNTSESSVAVRAERESLRLLLDQSIC